MTPWARLGEARRRPAAGTCGHGDLLAALHRTQRRAAQLTAQVGTLTAALARMVALEDKARRRAEDCEARHGAGFGGFEGRHD